MRNFILAVLACTMLVSCKYTILKIHGVNPKYTPTVAKTKKYATKLHIDSTQSFYTDTTWINAIAQQYGKTSQFYHDMYQPLGAFYYDSTGRQVASMINCYAGGFLYLKWNRNNALATFPPKQNVPTDSSWVLQKHLKNLAPLYNATVPKDTTVYVVVIHWSHYMGRQNKRFLKYYRKNLLLAPKIIRVLYVNTDILLEQLDDK